MNEVAVSTLAMDLDHLKSELFRVNTADYIHVDVMDGDFVPEETFWTDTVDQISELTEVPLDIHLMTATPQHHVGEFADEAEIVNFHIEATENALDAVERIQARDAKAGVAINPDTSLAMLDDVADVADHVLVMSVEPGEGGQSFIDATPNRIGELKQRSDVKIEVDGGIDEETGALCVDAGADILTSGSYVHESDDPALAIDVLRNL